MANILYAIGFEAEATPPISEANNVDGDDEDALMELFDPINNAIIEKNRADEQKGGRT